MFCNLWYQYQPLEVLLQIMHYVAVPNKAKYCSADYSIKESQQHFLRTLRFLKWILLKRQFCWKLLWHFFGVSWLGKSTVA